MPVQGANKASSQGWKKLTENSVVWFALGMIVTGVLGTVAWLAWLDGHIEGQIKTSDTVKKISLSVEEALKKSDVLFAQALKKRDVVFAQCSGGNCFESKAGTANCPEGKIIRSGVWHYSVPDTVPHDKQASWLMCQNLSGQCAAGEDHCSIPQPVSVGCNRPNRDYEVGIVMATCS